MNGVDESCSSGDDEGGLCTRVSEKIEPSCLNMKAECFYL